MTAGYSNPSNTPNAAAPVTTIEPDVIDSAHYPMGSWVRPRRLE